MEANRPVDIFFDGDIHDSQFAYLFECDDIPFWVALAEERGPRVLELACGTGRITLPIAAAGASVDGIDFSESMLAVARERATERRLAVRFLQGDIRHFSAGTEYDLVFLPAGTFMHLLTRADVESFFAGVRRALKAGGTLAFDVYNPTASWLSKFPIPSRKIVDSFEHRKPVSGFPTPPGRSIMRTSR